MGNTKINWLNKKDEVVRKEGGGFAIKPTFNDFEESEMMMDTFN